MGKSLEHGNFMGKIMGNHRKMGQTWKNIMEIHDEHVAPWENHRKTLPNCGKIMEIHDGHVAESWENPWNIAKSWANHGKMWQSVIS